ASYWGDPLRGALAWLSQPGHAAEQAEVYLHPPGALAMAEMYRGLGLLRPGLTLVSGPEAARRARYFVYQNRRSEWDDLGWMLSRTAPRQVIEAAGAPVAFIWERQGD
ncbi:MAG: hypothetical protein HUU35_18610, partial [Armatimonadetes bacterium]|nr:hypothetical protein [Armatimonadota bacterium]